MRDFLILILFLQLLPSLGRTQEVVMQFDASEAVNFIVTDPKGRRTGVDPRYKAKPDDWLWLEEIPKANYAFMSVGNLDPNGPVEVFMEFVYHFNSPEGDGVYTVQVIGNNLSTFELFVDASGRDRAKTQDAMFETRNIPIDKDSVITYLFTYHGAPGSPVSLVKVVSASSLLQDVAAMRKLNWITSQATVDKYVSLYTAYGTQFAEKDFDGAHVTLSTVITNLRADSAIWVTADAYKSLRADADQLLNELRPAPLVLSLEPSTILVRSGAFTLIVTGCNFVSGSTVYWNGSARTTTFLADTSLRATILASDVAKVDSPLVTVKNPDGSESNALRFTILKTVPMLLDDLRALLAQLSARGEVGDGSFVKQFDKDLQQAKQEYEKRDSIGCAQQLESFQRDLKKEYLAKPKKNDNRFVTEDAYKLLYFNTQYVMERAITLPPRSYAPLVDQLTSLRAQIRSDAQQGFLGGEILLKGLEIMVDGAKQRLQRRDSVGTALYVSFFQQTVRQTYELTKGRPIGKIYVKPEGYISLYYRAGYILEKLPEPLGQFMPRMEPELEQELQRYQRQVEQQK